MSDLSVCRLPAQAALQHLAERTQQATALQAMAQTCQGALSGVAGGKLRQATERLGVVGALGALAGCPAAASEAAELATSTLSTCIG